MTLTRRQRWLGGALVATLGATVLTAGWGDDDPASTDEIALSRIRSERSPVTPSDRRSFDPMAPATAGAGKAAAATTAQQQRGEWSAVSADALAAWGDPKEPPPRPRPIAARAAPAASAPPAPVAPPLAYRYVGRILEDGHRRAMLVSPQHSILVGEKEVIEGQWRVEFIDDAEIRWLWLPGAVPGRLAFAS
jgi:hypothetical protein